MDWRLVPALRFLGLEPFVAAPLAVFRLMPYLGGIFVGLRKVMLLEMDLVINGLLRSDVVMDRSRMDDNMGVQEKP